MSTNVVHRQDDDRRPDRLCAVALVVSAALALIQSSGWFVRLPAGEHLIPYVWVPVLAEGIVLLAVARSFASGRQRDASSAFLIGFSALALLDAANGLRSLNEIGGPLRSGNSAMWFSAAVIEVGVGVRALTLTLGQPRRRVPISRVATVIVVVVVFAGFTAVFGDLFLPSDLLAFVAIAAIPVVALRRAKAAVPVLWGLTVSLMLGLARRLLGLEFISSDLRFGLQITFVVVPAIVVLGTLIAVIHGRIDKMSTPIPSIASPPSTSGVVTC